MGTVSLPNTKEGKVLHYELINEHIKSAQYAVRGELYLRAQELQKEGMTMTYTNGMRRHRGSERRLIGMCCDDRSW